MKIKHFSHKHWLTLDQEKLEEWNQKTCDGCRQKMSGDFYSCEWCYYYVCKSCAGLPREMRHPFHKEHPLTLLAESPYEASVEPDESPNYESADESSYCDACSMKFDGGFIFHCSECNFDLDVNCATLMPTTTDNYKSERQITHPHPLIPCYRKNTLVDFSCSFCKLPIKGTIYTCLDCGAILHKSCAQLPQEITHHFHPHHSLTLVDSEDVESFYHCKACGLLEQRVCYGCYECPLFILDVRCASLVPKAIKNQQIVQLPIAFTHPHVLIPCDTNNIFSFTCSACNISIDDGTVYVCLECERLLHKSCAELPLNIKHPFHPPHPLVLSDSNRNRYYRCQACKYSVFGFSYGCAKCHFQMDVTCASQSYSTFKVELHQHPIAFFNDNKRNNPRIVTYTEKEKGTLVTCASCKKLKGFPFFRCVPCDFSIRLCCLPILPHTFKHTDHGHSLTLTYSPIKHHSDNDGDSQYYCDLCEELRELRDPTYYCRECDYVAEASCVFNEILPLLEIEGTLVSDGEILILQEKVNALITELEIPTTRLDKLKERRARLIGNSQIRIIEAETKNASPDHLNTIPLDEAIALRQNVVDARTAEIKTLTTKLDDFKARHPHHVGGYQIGSIPSLGTNSSVTFLDDSDEVVEEDCSVESTKKDEEDDEESNGTMKKDEDEDEESDGTFSNLDELDKEIAKLEALTAKLEALKKKRARRVSLLNLI